MRLEAAFNAEAFCGQQAFDSDDARAGLTAFANRETPRFPAAGTDSALPNAAARLLNQFSKRAPD